MAMNLARARADKIRKSIRTLLDSPEFSNEKFHELIADLEEAERFALETERRLVQCSQKNRTNP